ncbi:hypothetical protein [Paracoccus denitrificans]|uniref:hypothetical protein n=1 Tax=Paracoccus denitrificans TaxID=266 RepID=UPI0033650456
MANNINDDDVWWSRPRSKYIPSPLHAAVDVQAAVDGYERMDNVKIRARDVIYASISTWTGFQWKDRGSIPVVRKGQLVNSVPGLGIGNALTPPLPLPDHVIEAAFTPNATELKKKREGIEALIASLEAVRAAAAALDVNSWWGLGATWDNRDGNDSINALAGARGGLHSGATLKALADYNQGMASDEYGNHLSRLMGLTDMGQASAANTAQASNAFAQMGSNALANKGNALAGGAAGFNNAIQDGINSGINLWGYQQGLSRQQPAGFTPTYSAWRP